MLLYINKKYFSFKINYCFDLKMQPFWFFAAVKEVVCYPMGTLRESASALALYVWSMYKLYCNTNILS
ncbi:hypothetical protein [Brachyspira pilosicoli]|uniref:hypothetical protein n=1 Tax=Brachyspira pilosicoli TaxID=52584 RepID=UPI002543763D|nr:hypothetical protein [Brachyspira pilosicoli]WIH81043.1 hypothetical protein NEI04_09550 [Brachyspira pilosicoli]WIH87753.1 hypothetical protein NEI05_09690 [Brachyspira pilosicoli]